MDFQPVMAMARRVLAAKAAAKVQDQSLWLLYRYTDIPISGNGGAVAMGGWPKQFLKEHLQEIRNRRLKLLQDFAYLKVRNCYSPGGGLDDLTFDLDRSCLDFLRKAAEIPCVQWDAEERIRLLMQYVAREGHDKVHPTEEPLRAIPRRVPAPLPKEVPNTSSLEVALHSIPFRVGNCVEPQLVLRTALSTIDDVDLFVGEDTLYLMKNKDELRPLPLQRKRRIHADYVHQLTDRVPDVCFDGQFIWLLSPDPDRFLAVIEPRSEQIWKLTAGDGLPPMGPAGAAVAPLAPGKICAAGYFGRSWCGIATFKPETGVALKVFFEARELAEKRVDKDLNPHIAIGVSRLATLMVSAGAGQPEEQKILWFGDHTLLIDPQKPAAVRVINVPYCQSLVCVHEGAVYRADDGGQPCRLYRHAYSDFKNKVVQRDGRFGPVAFYNGRVYMWCGQLYVADNLGGPFRALRESHPSQYYDTRWYPNLVPSRHYGLVVLGLMGGNYRIELLKP